MASEQPGVVSVDTQHTESTIICRLFYSVLFPTNKSETKRTEANKSETADCIQFTRYST